MTLENAAVMPGLAFNLIHFNCTQEKHDILMNRDGTSTLNGRVCFVKLPAGNYIQATWVEHGADLPATVAAMMRLGQQRSINSDDLHISLGHTNDANARETAKQMGIKATGIRGYCDGCGEAKAIRRAVLRETKVESGRRCSRSSSTLRDQRSAVLYASGGWQHQRRMAGVSAGQKRSYLVPRLSRVAQCRQTRGGDLLRFGHCSFKYRARVHQHRVPEAADRAWDCGRVHSR